MKTENVAAPAAVPDPDKETSPAGEVLKSLKAGTGSPDQRSGADLERVGFLSERSEES